MVGLRRKRGDDLEAVRRSLDGYELPSFTGVVGSALDLLADPDVDMRAVARAIEPDPGLSVQVLRMSNSAALGLRNQVDSLDRAVAMLGRNQIESILISRAARSSLPVPASPVFDWNRFWSTAARRAAVAGTFAEVLDPRRRSESFTAALLQDMALPVLVDRIAGYDEILGGWYSGDSTDLASVEVDRFGWDHGTVGAELGRVWDFPSALVHSIADHNLRLEQPELVAADLVAGWHEIDPDLGPRVLRDRTVELGLLDAEQVSDLLETALARVDEVVTLFG